MKPTLDTERLKKKRQEKGWSKNQAAQEMGLLQSAYLRYENGERSPSYSALKNMAWTLGTSIDYLTGVSDDPRPTDYVISSSDFRLNELIESFNAFPEDKKDRLYEYMRKML